MTRPKLVTGLATAAAAVVEERQRPLNGSHAWES
jgi:hypothetical protein